MPLRIVLRKDTGALTIFGTVAGQRIRRRAQTNNSTLAREEAAALEVEILRTAWHGARRGTRSFAEAARSYLEAAPRTENHARRVERLVQALGNVRLGSIQQETAIELRRRLLRPASTPRTYVAEILMPLCTVLHHAQRLGWVTVPHFEKPRPQPGRTLFLLPDEAERLIAAAAAHLRPLLLFLLGTGARMSEALELTWDAVDLRGGRAILWRTKNGRRRDVLLPARATEALAGLSRREGAIFRWEDQSGRLHPYVDRGRRCGGQIRTAWSGAIKRADLDPRLRPHDARHTWASWHYALHRDLLALKIAGGWSSVTLVERYAHLLPAGHETAIRRFLDWHVADTSMVPGVESGPPTP
jgi:integrase